jgi:hypothetical protein
MRNSKIRHLILKPPDNTPVQPKAHGELRYKLEGNTAFFVFNGYGLVPGTYYGLYFEGNLLGLGFTVESGIVNIQGFGPSEIMEGGEFSLCSLDMAAIRPHEHILQSD